MKSLFAVFLLVASCCAAETFQAWVSDEKCAAEHAKQGVFTGTNPECAKKCISEGKSVVPISESKRKVYQVANPAMLELEVGNLVEITGTISGDNVHIDQVRHIADGVAPGEETKKK